jgi:hypothetical protein
VKRGVRAAVGLYAVIGLLVFGLAASTNRRAAWAQYSVCQSVELNALERGLAVERRCEAPLGPDAGLAGLIAGIFWPLYLSWYVTDEAIGEGDL